MFTVGFVVGASQEMCPETPLVRALRPFPILGHSLLHCRGSKRPFTPTESLQLGFPHCGSDPSWLQEGSTRVLEWPEARLTEVRAWAFGDCFSDFGHL